MTVSTPHQNPIMNPWIDDSQVEDALESGDFSALAASACLYAVSPDAMSAVVIRRHAAWYVPGQGWRDANQAPADAQKGRDVLNFFTAPNEEEPGVGFKCFLPQTIHALSLTATADGYYVLQTQDFVYKALFSKIPSLVWDLITGQAEQEKDIVSSFESIWASRIALVEP